MKDDKRIVIAMSGGVDSSVAAALLKKQGYDVIGMTMKIWSKESCGYDKQRACCSLEGVTDARVVAEKIGIPYYVIDFEKEFKKEVIDYFCNQYISGYTPNPCIVCNEKMKFGYLMSSAEKLGARFIATGHYAKVELDKRTKRYLLKRGRDSVKDQSYVLFNLTQPQLSQTILPLGYLTKFKVRAIARKLGLKHVYDKLSSQEICFIPDNNYPEFLKKERGLKAKQGQIVDIKGKVLSVHEGVAFYTIGQRHGLGIAHSKPLYVVEIDKQKNQIVVGEREYLGKKIFIGENVNWISVENIEAPVKCKAKIRYTHKPANALVKELDNKEVMVEFDKPQEAITPGQAAVFYKGDTVVGGAWIKEVLK